jgi:pimeloyl-ACP methyl ester carboxylesterase
VVIGAVVSYVGLCAVLFVFQRSLIYFPQPRAVTAPQSTLRLPVDGAELVISIRPHPGPKAIIYVGGNAEDVSDNLAEFDQWFPEHALYLVHYRGYGGSTGSPTEEDNHRDAAAVFNKVHAEHSEIVVIGRSLGTGVAVRLASESAAARLVLVTPYDSLAEIAARNYPFLPTRWLLRDKYESAQYAPAIKIPTSILAAENDEVIPRASTERLFARFQKGVASMTIIQGAGHNSIGTKSEYRLALQAALKLKAES